MATPFLSIKTLLDQASLVSPEQFDTWSKQWRTAVDGGSDDSLLSFFSREKGISARCGQNDHWIWIRFRGAAGKDGDVERDQAAFRVIPVFQDK